MSSVKSSRLSESDRINLRYLCVLLIGKAVIYGGAIWLLFKSGTVRFP